MFKNFLNNLKNISNKTFEGFINYFKSLGAEWKAMLGQSRFHKVRYLGVLLIPILYGFVYVFAFWNPFDRTKNLPIAVAIQLNKNTEGKYEKTNDNFANAFARVMGNKTQEVKLGEKYISIDAENIYVDLSNEAKIKNYVEGDARKYNTTIAVPDLDNALQPFLAAMADDSKGLIDEVIALGGANSPVEYLADSTKPVQQLKIFNNFKKNFIIAFGLDTTNKMTGTRGLIFKVLSQIFEDKEYKEYLKREYGLTDDKINKFNTAFKSAINPEGKFEPVAKHTQMEHHDQAGFGFAGFFLIVGLWIGSLAATFAVHPRIYKKKQSPKKRYFTKFGVLGVTISLQATFLWLTFTAIGFHAISPGNWFATWLVLIFTSFIFASIIQSIRWSSPTKAIAVIIVIVLLILQMSSNGGIFPIETQSGFYKFLNIILPQGHLVNMVREGVYETDWAKMFTEFGILLIYPAIFIPFGLWMSLRKEDKFIEVSNKIDKKIAEGGLDV